jgi:hydroxymethylpyrimidine kinase/phosphomethylpyrimidine kinase
MQQERPYTISIAGFDPSGGAGILADIKTFEMHKTMGLGVCSAITYQNEDTFIGVDWLPIEQILKQTEILLDKYPVSFLKIGLVESVEVLLALLNFIHGKYPGIKVIWDPVIKASAANYAFHANIPDDLLNQVCKHCFLITPNMDEAAILFGINRQNISEIESVVKARQVNILLKGGHCEPENDAVSDLLFTIDKTFSFNGERFHQFKKHGTGCILSAAITANLTNGFSLAESCLQAKKYIEHTITSNSTLLGYHYK